MAFTFKHGDRPLEGYTIQRAVGRGGVGEGYYSVSDGGREVALKYLRDNPQVELRGVSNCINLKSPYLVSIFDVKKTTDGDYMIIMEYCSGPSLRDLMMAEPNGFPPEKAAFFAREIAKGLAYLHDRGIVHRDLKPGNIFFDDGYVKIGDYGLSKFISVSRHSAQTASVGTVHYMAPEIGSGDYSRGVDIYALGVVLYEMLRGTVPFEGSTMAEILMKHLMSQPEVDALPAPFANVVRKSLEKDPRNRYQTVNEMMDEMLSTEQLQQSVAGFSAQSLAGAVRHGGAGPDSPMPSPNPPPRGGAGYAPRPGERWTPPGLDVGALPLPPKIAKKHERWSRKLEQKLNKLGAKAGRAARANPEAPTVPLRQQGSYASDPERRKRIALSLFLAVCLSVVLGVLFGNSIMPEAGITAAMLVPAMSAGVALSRKTVKWFGADVGPRWAERMVQLATCAPLIALANVPLFVESQHGLPVFLGLLCVAVFAKWEKALDRASTGEMSFGCAIGMALGGLICTAIAGGIVQHGTPQRFMFLSAAVAGVASLVLQASSWWGSPTTAAARAQRGGRARFEGRGMPPQQAAGSAPPPLPPIPSPAGWVPTAGNTGVAPVDDAFPAPGSNAATSARRESVPGFPGSYVPVRWAFTRMFWGLIAFFLMGGAIVTALVPLILGDLAYDDVTGCIVGCAACASCFLFAIQKTTPMKRPGFWRESLAPFLRSSAFFGIAGIITGIARYWFAYDNEERILSLVGLVFSILLLGVTSIPARRRRSQTVQPFFQGSDSDRSGARQVAAIGAGQPAAVGAEQRAE